MSENKNNENNKFQIIIIVLLAIIICFQLIHCIKLYEISYNSQLTNMAIFGSDINSSLKKELDTLKIEANKVGLDLDKKPMPNHPRPKIHNRELIVKKEKIDISDNMYTLEMKVPMKFTKKDVDVNFKHNILTISFEGVMELKNENIEESNVFSVYKSFLVPNTKATIKDVEYNVKDGILTVHVPIIK